MIHFNWQPSSRDLRIFAVGQIACLTLVAVGSVRRGGSVELASLLMGVSATVGLVGAVRPALVRWIYVSWMIVMFPIGWCVSHLLLTSVFWLVITPIGLVLRCCGIDPLERRFDAHRKSYSTRRGPMPPTARYLQKF